MQRFSLTRPTGPIRSSCRKICLSVCQLVPFHEIYFCGIRQALACNKTGSSICHASILLHTWSPQNGGGCRASIANAWSCRVDACTGFLHAFFVRVFVQVFVWVFVRIFFYAFLYAFFLRIFVCVFL